MYFSFFVEFGCFGESHAGADREILKERQRSSTWWCAGDRADAYPACRLVMNVAAALLRRRERFTPAAGSAKQPFMRLCHVGPLLPLYACSLVGPVHNLVETRGIPGDVHGAVDGRPRPPEPGDLVEDHDRGPIGLGQRSL